MTPSDLPLEDGSFVQYSRLLTNHYQGLVVDMILCRSAVISQDPEFVCLARELSAELKLPYADAVEFLRPIAQAMYVAAEASSKQYLERSNDR